MLGQLLSKTPALVQLAGLGWLGEGTEWLGMLQAYQELGYSVVVWMLFFWAIYAFFRDH